MGLEKEKFIKFRHFDRRAGLITSGPRKTAGPNPFPTPEQPPYPFAAKLKWTQ